MLVDGFYNLPLLTLLNVTHACSVGLFVKQKMPIKVGKYFKKVLDETELPQN